MQHLKGLFERQDDIHSGLKAFLISRTEEFFPDKSNKLSQGEVNLHRSVVKELSDIAHMDKSSGKWMEALLFNISADV